MGELISIILFFVYTWGLGFTATKFLKNSNNSWETNLMRIGIGLGTFPVIVVLLNLLHFPIDWKIFLAISLILPLYSLIVAIKNKKFNIPKPKLTKSMIYILIVLLLFLGTFFMYHKGAFSYPYLEDDDPWDHAKGIKFVALEKTIQTPEYFGEDRFFYYMDPYPPGYEALQGVMHQTNDSISWSMKFFNALIISLGIIFFFFFAKEFIGNSRKALFSTFALVMIPAYLSHFIWAHSLVMTLFIPAMYCLERIKHDKKWAIPTILVIAGICLTHPEQPIKMGILFMIYFITKSILQRKILKTEFFAIMGGYILSLSWWAFKWRGMLAIVTESRFGESTTEMVQTAGVFSVLGKLLSSITKMFPTAGGTATRAYSFNDFFIAKSQNMINSPIGIGIFLSILTILALIYIVFKYKSMFKEKNNWLIISLVWFIFTFLFVNSVTFNLPIGFKAFRMWMLLAIPISLLVSQGAWYLASLGKRFKISKSIIFTILIIGIILTSGYQKYSLNTAMWPPGKKWTSMEELQGYIWLKTLPLNTKVFNLRPRGDKVVIGFDKFSCAWCSEVVDFRADVFNKTTEEIYTWLKRNKYEYFLIGGMSYKYFERDYGENATNEFIQTLIEDVTTSGKFTVAHQTQGMILFKVL